MPVLIDPCELSQDNFCLLSRKRRYSAGKIRISVSVNALEHIWAALYAYAGLRFLTGRYGLTASDPDSDHMSGRWERAGIGSNQTGWQDVVIRGAVQGRQRSVNAS